MAQKCMFSLPSQTKGCSLTQSIIKFVLSVVMRGTKDHVNEGGRGGKLKVPLPNENTLQSITVQVAKRGLPASKQHDNLAWVDGYPLKHRTVCVCECVHMCVIEF